MAPPSTKRIHKNRVLARAQSRRLASAGSLKDLSPEEQRAPKKMSPEQITPPSQGCPRRMEPTATSSYNVGTKAQCLDAKNAKDIDKDWLVWKRPAD